MIAKITRGARPGDIGRYLHGPGRQGEHQWRDAENRVHQGGIVIGGNLAREGQISEQRWAADLRLAASARPDAVRPIWHMSLRCAPEDRTLTNAEWRSAVQEMGERMGWAEHPHVIVWHGDDHVHVVVSRVAYDGQLWHGQNDARAAQQARQHVEKRLGLRQVPTRAKNADTRRDSKITQGEYRRGVAQGKAPERVELAYRVEGAVQAAEGLGREVFEKALDKAGVDFEVNVASTGRVSGYRFHLPGHTDAQGAPVWWKASQLDRELSWTRVRERVGEAPRVEPEPIAPKGLLETRSSYERRTHEAQAAASDHHAAQVDARLEQIPTGPPVHVRLQWRQRAQGAQEKARLQRTRQLLAATRPTGDTPRRFPLTPEASRDRWRRPEPPTRGLGR